MQSSDGKQELSLPMQNERIIIHSSAEYAPVSNFEIWRNLKESVLEGAEWLFKS
jgi:hypothetical protein